MLAAALGAAAQEGTWTWSVTPYAWMAGIDGDLGAHGLVAPVEKDFSDVWDDLDMAGMLTLDGNNGKWGFYSDMIYLEMSDEAETRAGKVEGSVEEWVVTAAPYLRLKADEAISVDVGAGVRYLNADVDVTGPLGGGSESDGWFDPIVTGRVRWEPAQRCSLTLTGDIGGFGVASDLTWQLAAMAGYQVCSAAELRVGYRVLSYDYEDGGLLYDVDTGGFALGVSIGL
jgi:hypothetical protein